MKTILPLAVLAATVSLTDVNARAGLLDGLLNSAEVSNVYKAADFNSIYLEGAHVPVLGVASNAKPLTAEEEAKFVAQFIRVTNAKSRLTLENSPALTQTLGVAIVHGLLATYQKSGDLDLAQLDRIKAAYPAATHLAVVCLDRDEISRSRSRQKYEGDRKPETKAELDAEGSYKTGSMIVKTGTVKAMDTYTCTREVALTVELFDLAKGVTMWSSRISKRATVTETRTHTFAVDRQKTPEQQWADAVASGLINGVAAGEDPYPAPAALDEMLEDMFKVFAQKLPEPDKKYSGGRS